jgi:hypothetical protein
MPWRVSVGIAAEDGQASGDGGGSQARLVQGAFVQLDVVGGDFQRGDALGLHVPGEVEEVAAIRLDRVIRQQGVADPGDQGGGGLVGGAAAGFQSTGEEGGDLVGGRCVAVEEVVALGHQGRAARRQSGQAGAVGGTRVSVVICIGNRLPHSR